MRPQWRLFAYLIGMFIYTYLSLGIPNVIHAQNPKRLVEELVIEGNRRLTDEYVLSHIKTRPGEPFNETQVRRDLVALLESGVFDTTQTRVSTESGLRGGSIVIFHVAELPLILKVTFRGFRGIKESELLHALREKQINLSKDEVCNPVKVRAALRILQELAKSRGLPDVTFTVRDEAEGTYASIEFAVSDAQQ